MMCRISSVAEVSIRWVLLRGNGGGGDRMSEVNYRRNGMKYSTTGKCWGIAPKAGVVSSDFEAKGTARPKSSRERRALKKDK